MSKIAKESHREHRSRAYWMNAVQNRPNSTGRLTGSVKFNANVPKSDAHEYFANTLRKNIGSGNTGTGTLDLRTARIEDVPFLSTSGFLREQFAIGSQPSPKMLDAKMPPGTPFYKTPEEYYDEVLDLRKQLTKVVGENSLLKAKQRRIEDELSKKDKELVQVFENKLDKADSGKMDSGRSDKSTNVQNLKLRLFKLEQNYKTKETELRRLEADIRNTDIVELRHQLDMCMGQIATLRYHNAKMISGQISDRSNDVIQVIDTNRDDEDDEYSETDSFTSDSETGFVHHRSRSVSQQRSASASRLSLNRIESGSKLPSQPAAPPVSSQEPPKPTPVNNGGNDERPPSSDRPRCNLKEHKRLEEVERELKELYDAVHKIEARREELGKSQIGQQKLPLKGTPYNRLLALDEQETQLLQQVNALTRDNEEMKEKLKHLEAEIAKQKDHNENNAISELQSIIRAHSSRVSDKEQIFLELSHPHQEYFDEMPDEPAESSYVVSIQSLLRAHMERRATYERSLGNIVS